MSCGAPCVSTRTGACDILVEDGTSGLLCQWGDSEALAKSLEWMIMNEASAREMGWNARQRMGQFSMDNERFAWVEIYRNLLNDKIVI